ncbi:MAG: hypothetical protein HQ512_11385 [Rhodospirillales bacterium]|nr:hypothetical protein [Rhodospirillales bacterium]
MTEIRNFFANLFVARQSAGRSALPYANKGANNSQPTGQPPGQPLPAARTVFDTVKLSDGGQKIVNLARGQELAKEFRNAPLDEDYAANLLKAQEDIFRITRLFTETIKAAFPAHQGKS